MRRSRVLGWGVAVSALAHVVVLGLILPERESRTVLEEPLAIALELAPRAGRAGARVSADVQVERASVQPASRGNITGRATAATLTAQAVEPVSLETDSSGIPSGPSGDQGEDGTGVESRWKVAPRGRYQPRPALKPDCSISNPEYIWPGREAFCAAQAKPEAAREL